MSDFVRSCPVCNIDLFYKSKKSFYNSCWKKSPCRSCTQLGHTPWNKGLSKETDIRVAEYSDSLRLSWDKSKEKNTRIVWNSGLTSETDSRVKVNIESTRTTLLNLHKEGKISVWNKGKPFPQVAGDKSPTKRPEVREKMAIAALALKNKKYKCAFNKDACILFDEINKEMGWSGLHAMNNAKGEHRVYGTMYHVDFYEPSLNIVIEYYEKRHNRTKQKIKDIIRQNRIIDSTNCHFYIIKQGEENLWRQTINKPFWLQGGQVSLDRTLLGIA